MPEVYVSTDIEADGPIPGGNSMLSFAHSALDMKSYAMAVLGTDFRGTSKRTMPRAWFGPARHTHIAVDDAIEQGHLWLAMRRAARAKAQPTPS